MQCVCVGGGGEGVGGGGGGERESFCGRDSEEPAPLTKGQVPLILTLHRWVTFTGSLSIAGSASYEQSRNLKSKSFSNFLTKYYKDSTSPCRSNVLSLWSGTLPNDRVGS